MSGTGEGSGPGKTANSLRLRTAHGRAKALEQYQALRRAGKVVKAVVIAEMANGDVTVLGQELTPQEIAPLLYIATEALVRAEEDKPLFKLTAHIEPDKRGQHSGGKARAREIKIDDNGSLVPPPGENFISCGECAHPHWFILHTNGTDQPSRYACTHCGNEVKHTPVYHTPGQA